MVGALKRGFWFDKAGQTEYPGSTVFGTTCQFNHVFIQGSVMRYYGWPWTTDLTTTSLVDGHFHHIAAVTENGKGGCSADISGSCRAGPNVVRLFVDGVMEATVSLGDLPGSVMQANWFYFGCAAPGACIHEGASSPTLQNFAAVTLHSIRASSSVRYTDDFAPPPVFAKDASTTILFNVNEGSGNKLHDEGNPETTATIAGATWSCQQPPSSSTTPPPASAQPTHDTPVASPASVLPGEPAEPAAPPLPPPPTTTTPPTPTPRSPAQPPVDASSVNPPRPPSETRHTVHTPAPNVFTAPDGFGGGWATVAMVTNPSSKGRALP